MPLFTWCIDKYNTPQKSDSKYKNKRYGTSVIQANDCTRFANFFAVLIYFNETNQVFQNKLTAPSFLVNY